MAAVFTIRILDIAILVQALDGAEVRVSLALAAADLEVDLADLADLIIVSMCVKLRNTGQLPRLNLTALNALGQIIASMPERFYKTSAQLLPIQKKRPRFS